MKILFNGYFYKNEKLKVLEAVDEFSKKFNISKNFHFTVHSLNEDESKKMNKKTVTGRCSNWIHINNYPGPNQYKPKHRTNTNHRKKYFSGKFNLAKVIAAASGRENVNSGKSSPHFNSIFRL